MFLRSRCLLLFLTVLSILCITPTSRAAAPKRETALDREAPYRRAIWVTRWDYNSPKDVERIMYNCASARFTDVLFQVRGFGTVYYKSELEPWAYELTAKTPLEGLDKDPGWDPLAVAIELAHRYGLRLHAYINVMPGWNTDHRLPRDCRQLWNTHRDWFMVDRRGRRMDPAKWYVFLDPGLPEVRNHLAALAEEIATRYPIDGLHLDYIRYPNEKGDLGYHPRVVKAFKDRYGKSPQAMPETWNRVRSSLVTETVRRISQAARKARPGLEITAAVHRDAKTRRDATFQNIERWIKEDLIDAAVPMNYEGDVNGFMKHARPYLQAGIQDRIWMGLWTNPKRNSNPEAQVRKAVASGFKTVAVFAYSDMFIDHRSNRLAMRMYRCFTGKE